MLILNVTYKVKPGKRDEFFEKLEEKEVGDKSKAEKGNEKYEYFFSREDEDLIFLVEHWADEEAFNTHCGTSHL